MTKTKEDVDVEVDISELTDILNTRNLILYNDDVNSFDFVIRVLVSICKHTFEQAEQCTFLIHFKGKCSVKNGSYEDLKPLRDAITEKGIKAVIQ